MRESLQTQAWFYAKIRKGKFVLHELSAVWRHWFRCGLHKYHQLRSGLFEDKTRFICKYFEIKRLEKWNGICKLWARSMILGKWYNITKYEYFHHWPTKGHSAGILYKTCFWTLFIGASCGDIISLMYICTCMYTLYTKSIHQHQFLPFTLLEETHFENG